MKTASSRLRIYDGPDLDKLIYEIGQRDGLHPGRIANTIIGLDLTDPEKRVVMANSLPGHVSHRLLRPHDIQAITESRLPEGRTHPIGGDGRREPSAKVLRTRGDQWRALDRALAATVAVSDDPSVDRKRLGACTVAELRYAGALRHRIAEATARSGDDLIRYADTVQRQGVATLDDLDDQLAADTVLGANGQLADLDG